MNVAAPSPKHPSARFGGKWVYPPTRLAIYIRDEFKCMWCTRSYFADNIRLSLDHVTEWCVSRNNDPSNLVTCCCECNSARGRYTDQGFIDYLHFEHGIDFFERLARIEDAICLPLERELAKDIHKQNPPWLRKMRRRARYVPDRTNKGVEDGGTSDDVVTKEDYIPF